MNVHSVFVAGLGGTSEAEVRKIFKRFGPIESVKVVKHEIGQPKGFGFINFCDAQSMEKVLRENDKFKKIGWFVRKCHMNETKDRLMCLTLSGFPDTWKIRKTKDFVEEKTGIKVFDMSQQGVRTMLCVRKKDVNHTLETLKDCLADGKHVTVVDVVAKVNNSTKTTVAHVLHELALVNKITPLLDLQQFRLLEKALRTLWVGNIDGEVTEMEVAQRFQEFGEMEEVTCVLKETQPVRMNQSRSGSAFVVFRDIESCRKVVETKGVTFISGRCVEITYSKPPKKVMKLAIEAGLCALSGQPTSLMHKMLVAAKLELTKIQNHRQATKSLQKSQLYLTRIPSVLKHPAKTCTLPPQPFIQTPVPVGLPSYYPPVTPIISRGTLLSYNLAHQPIVSIRPVQHFPQNSPSPSQLASPYFTLPAKLTCAPKVPISAWGSPHAALPIPSLPFIVNPIRTRQNSFRPY